VRIAAGVAESSDADLKRLELEAAKVAYELDGDDERAKYALR
jgi:hypothetical protein